MILLSEIIELDLEQAINYCLDLNQSTVVNDIWGIGMSYDLQDLQLCFKDLQETYKTKIKQ